MPRYEDKLVAINISIGKAERKLLLDILKSLGFETIDKMSISKELSYRFPEVPTHIFIHISGERYYIPIYHKSQDKIDIDDINKWAIEIAMKKLETGSPGFKLEW